MIRATMSIAAIVGAVAFAGTGAAVSAQAAAAGHVKQDWHHDRMYELFKGPTARQQCYDAEARNTYMYCADIEQQDVDGYEIWGLFQYNNG
jgi:hypothetical protein